MNITKSFLIFSLALLGVVWWLLRSTLPDEKKMREITQASTRALEGSSEVSDQTKRREVSKGLRVEELVLALGEAFAANDLEEFKELLKTLIEHNDTEALQALVGMDLGDWFDPVGTVLIEHYKDHPSGHTLERFELLRSNEVIFVNTTMELLRNHLNETSEEEVASYLLHSDNKVHFDVVGFQVGEYFAEQDPKSAVEAFMALEEQGRIRNDLLSGALLEWTIQDGAAVSDFLAESESSPALDEPIFNLVVRSKHEAPKDVLMTWADTITDTRMRGLAIEDLNTFYERQ